MWGMRAETLALPNSFIPWAASLITRPVQWKTWTALAVANLAIVQGGLTTTMELTASKVPTAAKDSYSEASPESPQARLS